MRTVSILALSSLLLRGQGASRPQFEVATIKPASVERALPQTGGPGTPDPGQIKYAKVSLRDLIFIAYLTMPYQADLPSWMEEDRFDIVAKIPAGATKADVPAMLQGLLEERFHLQVKHELRNAPAYALTVMKGPSKLTEYPADLPPEFKLSARISGADPDGIPIVTPGYSVGMMGSQNGQSYIVLAREPIKTLCRFLSRALHLPVIDVTGLTGRYDVRLRFSPEGLPAGDSDPDDVQPLVPAPTLFQAMSQLGLKLESRKMAVDFLVVEHAERKPLGN